MGHMKILSYVPLLILVNESMRYLGKLQRVFFIINNAPRSTRGSMIYYPLSGVL